MIFFEGVEEGVRLQRTQKKPPAVNPGQSPTSGLDNEATVPGLLQQTKGTMYQRCAMNGRRGLEFLVFM